MARFAMTINYLPCMQLTTTQFLSLLKVKWQTLASLAIAGALVGLAVSVVMPVRYRASMQLLILQRYAFARDAYTASKSIEYLSNVFAEVMYSQSFIHEVMNAGYPLANVVDQNPEIAKKQWAKMVTTRVGRDTGSITVTVYNGDPLVAKNTAEAIQYVLANKGDQYHGEGDRVVIRTLDAPAVSTYPVQPNVPVNALAGALLAIAVGVTLLVTGKDIELSPAKIWEALQSGKNENLEQERSNIAQWLAPEYAMETGTTNVSTEDAEGETTEPGTFTTQNS